MTDLLYLDVNCFQRWFDDQRQVRIQMEAIACREVFTRLESGELDLVWSFMHQDEMDLCPFPERQAAMLRLSELCKVRVGPEQTIYDLAETLLQQGPLTAKDAIHLACAVSSKSVAFLTCDDRLINRAKRVGLDIEIVNPVNFTFR